ncbi:MAG: histidine kinase [Ginsengibacter sp.]|jgi:sensor histidine kinase YesM
MQNDLSNQFIDRLLKQRVLLHVLFWIIVTIYFTFGYGNPGHYKVELFRSLAFLPNHIWLIYIFFYLLIPQFLLKNKLILFFVGLIICLAASLYFSYLINFKFLGAKGIEIPTKWSFGLSLIGNLTILGIAVSIKMLRYWYKQKQEILQTKQEQLTVELQMLKSQIHPHFLFNTLNNLYSLTLEQSKLAAPVVLKLSNLLRYMLYECNSNFVLLEKEIEIMNNYIELERIRYGERLDISVNYSGDIKGKLIAPLLFLPLLENCFKYGISEQIDQCWISVDLHVENDELKFKLINSKTNSENGEIAAGGIGLQNVQKRIQLLYGNNYTLKLLPTEDHYTVSLTLNLNSQMPSVSNVVQLSNKQSQLYETKMFVGG